MLLTAPWLPACSSSSDENSDPCPGRRYDRDTNVAVTQELIRLARGLVVGADERVRAIVEGVDRFNEERHPLRDTGRCGPDLDIAEAYVFTIEYLVSHPEATSPQLLQGLEAAANPQDPGASGGVNGVYNFVHGSREVHNPDYPGLGELRDAVQGRQVDLGAG